MRDSRGNAALEFAFVAPAFIALVVAIFQIAFIFLAQQQLETATEGAARYILTGQAQNGAWSAATFRQKTCALLPAFMSCSNLYVDINTVTSYAQASTSQPLMSASTYTVTTSSAAGATCTTSSVAAGSADANGITAAFNYCTGTQGAIVQLRLLYIWPTLSAPLGFTLANGGTNQRHLLSTSVLKTEGY